MRLGAESGSRATEKALRKTCLFDSSRAIHELTRPFVKRVKRLHDLLRQHPTWFALIKQRRQCGRYEVMLKLAPGRWP
jgi:hypothetical protein